MLSCYLFGVGFDTANIAVQGFDFLKSPALICMQDLTFHCMDSTRHCEFILFIEQEPHRVLILLLCFKSVGRDRRLQSVFSQFVLSCRKIYNL